MSSSNKISQYYIKKFSEIENIAAIQGWETGLEYYETGSKTQDGSVEVITLDYTQAVYNDDGEVIEEAKAMVL